MTILINILVDVFLVGAIALFLFVLFGIFGAWK
jgi:hypothetical protein